MPDSRLVPENTPDGRTPSQRDRDRVLYASHFARLAEITQVVSPERGYVFHNRLTHSLKVGQIARRIAEKCIRDHNLTPDDSVYPDPDVAEAAGLAHDLGHPPFGHVAEYELDTLVRAAGLDDGYEGNAQSFRIVVSLAVSDALDTNDRTVSGLNLTRRTLDGILKYPWGYGTNPDKPLKWGYYSSEEKAFRFVRDTRHGITRSLIAEIMDWADDITFAIHDLSDFYCAGLIPIDRCKSLNSKELGRLSNSMLKRKAEWGSDSISYEQALVDIVDKFPFEPDERYVGSSADRAKLHTFSSGLIGYFIEAFSVTLDGNQAKATVEPSARRSAEVLKQFIWEYIIENPDLAVTQNGQRKAIRDVFESLNKASQDRQFHLFPSSYFDELQDASTDVSRVRIVADCISGMTERELMSFYRRLSGLNGTS